MPRLLLLIFIIAFGVEYSQAQYYFFPYVGWNQTSEIVEGDYLGNYSRTIVESAIEGDTIINGMVYFKHVNQYGKEFLRQENGKLLKLKNDLINQEVIMDFSLEIGDSYTFEQISIPGGSTMITVFVDSKVKILGPGQESIYKMVLKDDLSNPVEVLTWIEGVGSPSSGLIYSPPLDEMTAVYQLCTRNEKNQTISICYFCEGYY